VLSLTVSVVLPSVLILSLVAELSPVWSGTGAGTGVGVEQAVRVKEKTKAARMKTIVAVFFIKGKITK
jgi:hypothetical protein